MKRAITSLLFLLLCPASLPAQNQKQILLGLASISGGIDLLYVTKKIGAFKRNGLDVDFILFQGGSQALQVLLAGDVKMISGGGGTTAQRARMKGAGNLLVATYTPTMPFSLYVNNKIQDGKQLKGSKIAISRFGSSSDFAARYILTRLGVEPAKEATLDADRQPARALRRSAERSRGRLASSIRPTRCSPVRRVFASSPMPPLLDLPIRTTISRRRIGSSVKNPRPS